MANDSDNIVVGATGQVYLAPVATAMPSDVTTVLPGTWKDVGYINDDGVTMAVDENIQAWTAWQSRTPVRRDRDTIDLTFNFKMMEFKRDNFALAMGGGTFTLLGSSPAQTLKYTPPAPGGRLPQYACVIQFDDGPVRFRLCIPVVERVDVGDIPINKANPINLDVTLGVIDDDGTGGWFLLAPDDYTSAWPLS